MKASFKTINTGLDQLFFMPFIKDESPQDRADTIESYLQSNGWTWDEYLAELAKD